MKSVPVDTPDLSAASVAERTGKTLKQWFAELDRAGGLEKGRRELTNHVYEQVGKDAWWAVTLVVEYEIAKGQKEKDGRPTGYSICSTKTVAAPLEHVFRAFGEAALLDRWLGAKTKIAFSDGGSFENADGNRGTFKRIRTNKDLRFSWDAPGLAPGSAVEVLFADKGKGKTGITLNHTRIATRREADQLREGWGAALERLKTVLEKA
jgi:uncharacterized protein YndB with AHSA1/START domain